MYFFFKTKVSGMTKNSILFLYVNKVLNNLNIYKPFTPKHTLRPSKLLYTPLTNQHKTHTVKIYNNMVIYITIIQ